MPQRLILYPYKMESRSATSLIKKLREVIPTALKVSATGLYRPRTSDVIINWGNSTIPNWFTSPNLIGVLNRPNNVARATNKLDTFNSLSMVGVSTPLFTRDMNLARTWIEDGDTVMCRTRLNAHSGEGIVIANSLDSLVPAPLYTRYKKKRSEYRVHVFMGRVIDIQEKRRLVNVDFDTQAALVRSHANGWVFCRDNINPPEFLETQAILSMNALGLDFGAVDIIYNQREATCYTLEINTAVGLEGRTLEIYKDAILNYYNNNVGV
jgi:glutathione synthase/RimK-type ligase-like ATP-grasp enzyme